MPAEGATGTRERAPDIALSRALRRRGALVLALFAPLWALSPPRACRRSPHRRSAVGMLLAGAAGLAVLALRPSEETSRIVVGVLAAGTLWVTSLVLSLRR